MSRHLTLCISEHFKVLHTVETFHRQGEISGWTFADPHNKGSFTLFHQQFFGVGTGDAPVVPVVRPHLDVVAGY